MSTLVPIRHLMEHDVNGERRWTGRAELARVMRLDVLVLSVGGTLMAVRNRCPHRDIPILNGRLDPAGFIECPSHGWELKLTGEELQGRPVVECEGGFCLVLE
jgi:nitrite reductase/ring-hydroxylating ferredoxin subunit